MKKRIQTLRVTPWQQPRRRMVKIITQATELWQHHYALAVEQGNNHQQAMRYASLMAR